MTLTKNSRSFQDQVYFWPKIALRSVGLFTVMYIFLREAYIFDLEIWKRCKFVQIWLEPWPWPWTQGILRSSQFSELGLIIVSPEIERGKICLFGYGLEHDLDHKLMVFSRSCHFLLKFSIFDELEVLSRACIFFYLNLIFWLRELKGKNLEFLNDLKYDPDHKRKVFSESTLFFHLGPIMLTRKMEKVLVQIWPWSWNHDFLSSNVT